MITISSLHISLKKKKNCCIFISQKAHKIGAYFLFFQNMLFYILVIMKPLMNKKITYFVPTNSFYNYVIKKEKISETCQKNAKHHTNKPLRK